jgi:methionyl aminopeptidase
VAVTEDAVYDAIQCCGPNQPFCFIGKKISRFAKKKRLNVVPAFTGHGIGSFFHGPPEILHFDNDNRGFMLPGMTFTIEPILSLGGFEIEILEDEWTAVTTDNSRTAQHEHTVLITEQGCEILTLPD